MIIGKPNVGKSSLLNALLGEERAIVTAIPGTTRDTVEESLSLGGLPLNIIDTAGIRESRDLVEKIGIERSKQALNAADLVLLVFDISEKLTAEDLQLLTEVPAERTILILNKSDLENNIRDNELLQTKMPYIFVSALHGTGLSDLEQAVSEMFIKGKIESTNDALVSNIRHITLLKSSRSDIEQALKALEDNMPIDLVNIDIDNARQSIGKITGKTVEEELLNYIFAEFCVGK